MTSKQDFITKIHLIISAGIVIPIAFVYGFKPELCFDMSLGTIDEHNFHKGIMGLYLGFSALWLLGVLKPKFLKTALITNMIFMLGLACGRIFSIIEDGFPTVGYVFGTVAELALGCYGIWVLRQYRHI